MLLGDSLKLNFSSEAAQVSLSPWTCHLADVRCQMSVMSNKLGNKDRKSHFR